MPLTMRPTGLASPAYAARATAKEAATTASSSQFVPISLPALPWFTQPLHKDGDQLALSCRRARAQVPDGWHRRLLRARRERPSGRRAAKECNEITAFHA